MNDSINFFCRHAGLYRFVSCVKRSSANKRGCSRFLNLLRSVNRRRLISNVLEVSVWLRSLGIIWSLNVFWNFSMSGKSVRKWTHWPSKPESTFYFYFCFLVRQFVHSPQLLEALLRAEETWLQIKLNASWTLHSCRFSALWIHA